MDNMYNKIMDLAHNAGFRNPTELCRAAGVPRAVMTELKMGRHNTISRENGEKFCRVLGCSLNEFWGYEAEKVEPTSALTRTLCLVEQLDAAELVKVLDKASSLLTKRTK